MKYYIVIRQNKIIASAFTLGEIIKKCPPMDDIGYKIEAETDIHKYTIDDCLLTGTKYQIDVWKAIASIPKGQTKTYGDLVRMVGGSPQAAGTACGKNKIPVVIPCHRVVGIKNKLAFSSGPELKKELLKLEGVIL